MDKNYIRYYVDEENDEVIIEGLFIAKSDRGHHKGYKLIDKAIERARLKGISKVTLFAYPQDDSITQGALIRYYRDYGFVSDGDSDALMEYEV